MEVPLAPLRTGAGAELIVGQVSGIDRKARQVQMADDRATRTCTSPLWEAARPESRLRSACRRSFVPSRGHMLH